MLIAYHLSSDKSRQTILHSCAHPNRLPSTASIIKMCPHLHVEQKQITRVHTQPKIYNSARFLKAVQSQPSTSWTWQD